MNKDKLLNWGLFALICFIWGSSFELMKLGMFENHEVTKPLLTPYQFAALRLFAAGVFMIPFAIKAIKQLQKDLLVYIVLSGILGSFIPAFLFCLAETKIGGGVAGSLNSLTPLFVIIVGVAFFKLVTTTQKIIGVLVGLTGSAILIYANAKGKPIENMSYTLLVVLATFFYGLNVNMVIKKLTGVPSTQIAAIAFSCLIIPSLLILMYTGYFSLPLAEGKYIGATIAGSTLGILGTAIASILFYTLMKRAGGIFASTVTYGIPFVAIFWGIINGEKEIGIYHFLGLFVILCGVYLANNKQ